MDEDTGKSAPGKEVCQVKDIFFELKVFVLYHTQKDHQREANDQDADSSS